MEIDLERVLYPSIIRYIHIRYKFEDGLHLKEERSGHSTEFIKLLFKNGLELVFHSEFMLCLYSRIIR